MHPALRRAQASSMVVSLIVSAAHAAPAPNRGQLERLRESANVAWRVKVTADRTSFLISKPAIDSMGVTVERPREAAFSSGDSRARRISWDEIESVDSQRRHRYGWLVGGLIGAGAGAIAASSINAHDADQPIDLILVATGTTLGLIVGALWRPPDQRLYP